MVEWKNKWVWPINSKRTEAPSDTEVMAECSPAACRSPMDETNVHQSNGVFVSDDGEEKNGVDWHMQSAGEDIDGVFSDLKEHQDRLASHKKLLPKLSTEKSLPAANLLSTVLEHNQLEQRIEPPSSPLLTALRNAVCSVNRMEDFEIIEKIGEGFYAEVYKVRHASTGQIMVLKKNIKASGVKTLREVELLKRLQHPNIVQYLGACVHEGQVHPLMEYANGGSMESLLHNYKLDLSWCLRINLAVDVSHGMQYLHSNGMLHRDLNSKNCLLRHKGSHYTAVVADFGLATRKRNPKQSYTKSQSIVGTAYWGAPELLSGKPYDEKADVFSFGIVLCEIMSRKTADPDEIPRTKDFGLDCDKFKHIIFGLGCPKEFLDLAYQCCKVNIAERILFPEITKHLVTILSMFSDTQSMQLVRSDAIPLQQQNARQLKVKPPTVSDLVVLPLPRLRRLLSQETAV